MLEIRIMEVFVKSGLNKQDFAERIGISAATMSHISSGRNKASTELIINLLTYFSEISPDWLLFGRGSMYREDNESVKKEMLNRMKSGLDAVKRQMDQAGNALENLKDELNGL